MVEIQPGLERTISATKAEHTAVDLKQYPTEDHIKEVPSSWGPVLLLPRWSFFGRQRADEYLIDKQRLAKQAFAEQGINYLYKNPIIASLIPQETGEAILIIEDGHHRFVHSGNVIDKNGTIPKNIPARIFTPAQMAQLLNLSGHRLKNGEAYTAESYIEKRMQDAREAQESFRKKGMPDYKQPKPLLNISSISDLQARYPTLSQ